MEVSESAPTSSETIQLALILNKQRKFTTSWYKLNIDPEIKSPPSFQTTDGSKANLKPGHLLVSEWNGVRRFWVYEASGGWKDIKPGDERKFPDGKRFLSWDKAGKPSWVTGDTIRLRRD